MSPNADDTTSASSAASGPDDASRKRVFMVGATGTIGRATLRALVRDGHQVTCFVRPGAARSASDSRPPLFDLPGVQVRTGDLLDPQSIARDGFQGERFDAVVSCMASRGGAPRDAWAIDHQAHVQLLEAAMQCGVTHWVQLSAICVQKPRLAFQHAKLAFEEALQRSPLQWSIVRPTAYFKSLSGQVQRVRDGRPYLLVGDGTLTRCTPISDDDCATYLAQCLTDPARWRRILPIGGPGEALTPLAQGAMLFELTGRPPRYRRVPVAFFDAIIAVLGTLGRLIPALADKAEFARIGRYYATESMLVWDAARGRYDADATPRVGHDTLRAHFERLLRGEVADDRGEHAVF